MILMNFKDFRRRRFFAEGVDLRPWLESLISRDIRVLRRWFLRNWKAETLSFSNCYFLLNLDLASSRYGHFQIQWKNVSFKRRRRRFLWIHWFLTAEGVVFNEFYNFHWFWDPDWNRSYLAIYASSGVDSFEIEFLRLPAFQNDIVCWISTSPARDTVISNRRLCRHAERAQIRLVFLVLCFCFFLFWFDN